jgi:nitrate/nitrite transport system permease protein
MSLASSASFCERIGLDWFAPLLRLIGGEHPARQLKAMAELCGVPLLAIALFLGVWQLIAGNVETSLGALPGPRAVAAEFGKLVAEHGAERDKAAAFAMREAKRNAERVARDPAFKPVQRAWTGKPTFFDQIVTSLVTVFTGFVLATLVAVPLGLLCGSSRVVQAALNPLIQIFKPVSPLAWLPIVTLLVSAAYQGNDGWLSKSFLVSAITVTLCSLWPTVINTALGVASVDRDLINVARVLRLSWPRRITRIVLPAALPLIFTGMRLSLGVGWMVLIAAEMLAQNPGLGKFVWDEFQNGSSQSLARIMVAVLVIGLVGFLLDRLMYTLQQLVSRGATAR